MVPATRNKAGNVDCCQFGPGSAQCQLNNLTEHGLSWAHSLTHVLYPVCLWPRIQPLDFLIHRFGREIFNLQPSCPPSRVSTCLVSQTLDFWETRILRPGFRETKTQWHRVLPQVIVVRTEQVVSSDYLTKYDFSEWSDCEPSSPRICKPINTRQKNKWWYGGSLSLSAVILECQSNLYWLALPRQRDDMVVRSGKWMVRLQS